MHAGDIGARRGEQALHDFADLPIARCPQAPFLARIRALRDNDTAYDAAYLALAEMLSAPLVILDARLTSIPGHTARVISLSRC